MRKRKIGTNDILERVEGALFRELLAGKSAEMHPHADDHLQHTHGDRGFTLKEELFRTIAHETPVRAYLQKNGLYRAYYRKKDGYRGVVIDLQEGKAIIITFMRLQDIPLRNDEE